MIIETRAPALQVTAARRRVHGRLVVAVTYALLVAVAALAVVPLLWAISGSFTPMANLYDHLYPFSLRALLPTHATLSNYQYLFEEAGFGRIIFNTLVLCVSNILVGGVVSAMAGFAFARFEFPGRNLLFGLIILAFLLPEQAGIIPLYILVSRLGWLNTWQGLIVPGLAQSMLIFLFRQFFLEIPQELIDAARVDGANWPRIMSDVVMPLSKPVLITGAMMLFLGAWNSFFWPLLVAPSPRFYVLNVAVSQFMISESEEWGRMLASSMISAIVPIMVMLPLQRYYVSGIARTGLQG